MYATRANATLGSGLLMMALAVALEGWWLAPWRESMALAEAGALNRPARPESTPRWPPADQTPQRSADLLAQALRQGLQVQGSRERPDAQGASLVLELQALGQYLDLRRFLAFALAADPALALESLQVRRDPGLEGQLRFDLRWRLLYQPTRSGGQT